MKDGTVALLAFGGLLALRLRNDENRDGRRNEGEGFHFSPLIGAIGIYVLLRVFR